MMSVSEMVTGLQHAGIPTNDLEKSICFYKSLGFEVSLLTHTEKEKVAFLKLNDLTLEVYENGMAVERSGAVDHLALNVTDIEAAYGAVKKLGYSALEGKICFLPFWQRGVRYFTITGPGGEKIEFNQKL